MPSRWCKPRCRRWRAPGERRRACCAGSVQPLDLAAANGATVVQAQQNGATLVTEVISDDQRAQELAEKRAREELIVTLKAQVEDGVEIKLQATRLFCSMARRGRRHRGDVDNSLVDFHTDR